MHAVAVAWQPHHVEHLAPVAALTGATVLLSDAPGLAAAARCYPGLAPRFVHGSVGVRAAEVLLETAREGAPDVVFVSDLFGRDFLRRVLGADGPRTVYVPHGFSEKRQAWTAGVAEQDAALLPGPLAVRQLHDLGVGDRLPPIALVGALRRRWYEAHRAFFDARIAALGVGDWPHGPTVVYAPTWADAIGSSSFLAAFSTLATTLPDGWRLVVKPHPHAEAQAPIVDRLAALAARPGVVVLRNQSLVLPLLERADALVADMSSLAYDYLALDRPMVFLNRAPGTAADASASRLFACGPILGADRYDEAFRVIEGALRDRDARYREPRATLDRDLHAPGVTLDDAREAIARVVAAARGG